MIIRKACKLIRDMELGHDENGNGQAAAHIKAAKTLSSEENFALLDQLGGDVRDLMNMAWDVFMRWRQGDEVSPNWSASPALVETLNSNR